MESNQMICIALSILLAAILITGICLKRYTKRRLKDIDGTVGIIKKADCPGMPICIGEVKKGGSGDERN